MPSTTLPEPERDFVGWLADVLAWDASLAGQLVKEAVGYDDEPLPGHA